VNVTVSGVSDAPVITQGAGPLAVTMSEDGSPTAWSAPTLGATDVDTASASLVWSVSSAASNGTATVSGTAAAPTTFTYAPNADFNGSDSFVVQVTDGALTDTITVNVTISGVNDLFTSLDGNTTTAVSHPENVLSVVTLTATDDDNQSLTYSISGGTDSALFEINATTNALQFIAHPDYEYPHDSNGDNAYAVTVIVSDGTLTDAIGEKIAQTFSIVLSDVFLPSVNTSAPSYITSNSATLHGEIEDSGEDPEGISEKGFVLGSTPDPSRGDIGVIDLPAGAGVGDFVHAAEGLSAGSIYYFRSYAINSEGSRYGPQRRFVTAKHESFGSLVNAIDKTSGWWSSEWLGDFYATGSDWIYHADFGWLFVYGDNPTNLWLWHQHLGWIWVSDATFPYFYSSKLSNWLLWKQTKGNVAVFFDYSQSHWISHSLVTSP
jgi:hypothetical protein